MSELDTLCKKWKDLDDQKFWFEVSGSRDGEPLYELQVALCWDLKRRMDAIDAEIHALSELHKSDW